MNSLKELQELTEKYNVDVPKGVLKRVPNALSDDEKILFICMRTIKEPNRLKQGKRIIVTDKVFMDDSISTKLYRISDVRGRSQRKQASLMFRIDQENVVLNGFDPKEIDSLINILKTAIDNADISEDQSQHLAYLKSFKEHKFGKVKIYINEEKQEWMLHKNTYSFSDVIECEIMENGSSITSTKTGSMLGRAAVGKAILGPAGMLMGGATAKKKTKEVCEQLSIKITLNNLESPFKLLHLIDYPTPKDDLNYTLAYNDAQKIVRLFKVMSTCENNTQEKQETNQNPYEELKQLKELLNLGIITAEEFEQKKKELLKL